MEQAQLRQMDPDLYYPGESIGKTGMTVFLYGQMGTWKTTWAATWPDPVFLSAGNEGGDDSLAILPEITGRPVPPVYQISSTKQLKQKVDFICTNYEKMGWHTCVVDSLTFFSDMWMADLMSVRQKAGATDITMTDRDWGLLEAFFTRDIAQQLHRTKLNIIWLALEKERIAVDRKTQSESVTAQLPYVSGASKVKIPAMCKIIIHAEKTLLADPAVPGRMIPKPIYWVTPSVKTKEVRHKYGNLFPDGKLVDPNPQIGDWPTYAGIECRVGKFIYR